MTYLLIYWLVTSIVILIFINPPKITNKLVLILISPVFVPWLGIILIFDYFNILYKFK
jgi:hypothetical protein